MPAISKAWVVIADSAVDPDSPLDAALMTAIRDDLVHVREWLGASYTAGAVQDHNHDGSNSALVEIGPNAIRNGSFEDGTNGWTLTPYTGGTITTNAANDMDGAAALAITSTVLANGGGVALSNEYRTCTGGEKISFKLAYKASVANISSRARVIWYDDAKAGISTNDVYNTTATPTTQTIATTVVTAPANSRFYRLEVTGGVPASGSATGTVYFDGLKGEASPAAGDTCTYTGSLVEAGGFQLLRSIEFCGFTASGPPGTGTWDLGSNRVMVGVRIQQNNLGSSNYNYTMYLRGYNLKNN